MRLPIGSTARPRVWPGVDWEHDALQPVTGLLETRSTHGKRLFGSTWPASISRCSAIRAGARPFPAHPDRLARRNAHADELHIHVLDLGGRNYRSLQGLPHLGAVICGDEEAFEERLQRLMDKLARLVDERSQRFATAGVANLYEYNAHDPGQAQPRCSS